MHMKQESVFAGSRQINIADPALGISFPALIHYPATEPSVPAAFGPYIMNVSPGAGIMKGRFPLVVISHGSGGSHLLYRTISIHLAKNGYVVVMPEHYGNNRNNNTLADTKENLVNRPRHISLTIDEILYKSSLGNSIEAESIAVIGHSMGGYTALALAGGIPRTKEGEKVEAPSDPRVKALVLMAPGAGWFMNSLQRVNIPILMYTAEHDPVTPVWNAEVVMNSVPDKSLVTHRMIKNAGHFSFLSPFPESMKKPEFLPSTDPAGFDREEFHKHLPEEILFFLDHHLKTGLKAGAAE